MSALAYPFWRFATFRPLHRLLQAPPRHSSGSPTTSATSAAVSFPDPIDRIRQANFDLLLESLAFTGSNPTRVWANYTNLITFLGYERLPLAIHQQVLRKCTPSSRLLRASAARRLFAGNVPRTPHVYEGRLQAVMRNIRASGGQPALDDYNFILEQFAAVGHHFGVMQVYAEIISVGLIPRTRTFGLCLQAIAHRQTLPIASKEKARRIAVTRRMVSDLVSAMKSFNIPFTSVNLDLIMRILKETTDMQSFETLIKWGYGIDLANPDCPPLEHLASSSATNAQPGPPTQPFSTAALNMTIDTLGHLGHIPRMVQAFEVLTTPLPRRATSVYDEDDDDDFGEITSASTFIPPSAPPNTTTYNIFLRHISRAGHAVLARHYLLQAMDLEKQVMMDLRSAISKMPLQNVPAPHFAINRGTLLSVFGHSNRDNNPGLMRWLTSKFPRILRKKRAELKYLTTHRDSRRRKKKWPYQNSTETMPELPSFPMNSAKNASQPTARLTIMQRSRAPKNVGAVFDLDLEDESTPTSTPSKTFNLDLHLRVLERDISEIEALYAYAQNMLARLTQRRNERLGRRIFAGKTIYLATERARRHVSRQGWEEIRATLQPVGRRPERSLFPWADAALRRRSERSSPQPEDGPK